MATENKDAKPGDDEQEEEFVAVEDEPGKDQRVGDDDKDEDEGEEEEACQGHHAGAREDRALSQPAPLPPTNPPHGQNAQEQED